MRSKMTSIIKDEPFLFWLPASGAQKLNNDVVLLGYDCFADGRYGDYTNSRVVLNDSRMIIDLFQCSALGKYPLLEKMQQLAGQDAKELENSIEQAVRSYNPQKIVILIHVPPFREVCMHEGKISSDDYLPFFSTKITGEILMHAAENYPEIEFLALCGHTHSKGFFQLIAQYFNYRTQDLFDWYFVHVILAACWNLEDNINANLFLRLAEKAYKYVS